EYIAEWAAEMPDDADPLAWGEQRAVADHAEVLEQMNVRFDTWFSERSLVDSGAMDATLADLRARGAAYDHDGAVWLRSSDHGDDKDRVLIKSDGEPTYLLPDVAYHRDKFARGFDLLIDVWGADHHGYVARMKAAMQALGHDPDEFEPVIIQLVNLQRGGQPVRLSKRTGEIVALREVIDEVGPDAARLTFLLQSIDTKQTFDLEVVASQAMENPVFYVQMAHARIAGIARVAAERGVQRRPLAEVDLGLLTHEREHEVLRRLSELPDVLAVACEDRAPHGPPQGPAETALRRALLPDTAEVLPDGSLAIGGCRVDDLAAEFGTPVFIYDEAHLRDRCREAVEVFGDGVAYAGKAFLCVAMARLVHEEGMWLDVATGGELHVALAAGLPAERLVLHGNNKTDAELARAREVGVGRIVVDSFDELDRLERQHAADGRVPAVLVRATPGIEAHTHEFVRTGQADSKFGFGVASGDLARAVERAQASPAV